MYTYQDDNQQTRRKRALDPELQAKLDNHEAIKISAATEEVMSINAFARQEDVAPQTLYKLLAENGIELPKRKFGAQIGSSLDDEAQAKARELLKPLRETQDAPEEVISLWNLARDLGMSMTTLRPLLDERGIELDKYKFGGTTIGLGVTPAQRATIEEFPEVVQLPGEDIKSVNAFAKEIGISFQALKNTIADNDIELPNYKFGPKVSGGLDKATQQALLAIPKVQTLIARSKAKKAK